MSCCFWGVILTAPGGRLAGGDRLALAVGIDRLHLHAAGRQAGFRRGVGRVHGVHIVENAAAAGGPGLPPLARAVPRPSQKTARSDQAKYEVNRFPD